MQPLQTSINKFNYFRSNTPISMKLLQISMLMILWPKLTWSQFWNILRWTSRATSNRILAPRWLEIWKFLLWLHLSFKDNKIKHVPILFVQNESATTRDIGVSHEFQLWSWTPFTRVTYIFCSPTVNLKTFVICSLLKWIIRIKFIKYWTIYMYTFRNIDFLVPQNNS